MRYWIDEESGIRMSEPDCCDEWLFMIWMVGVDYDGSSTATELKDLIDELVEMSQKARDCLSNGRLFPEEETTALEEHMQCREEYAELVSDRQEGGGCCCPDLWDENGKNCKPCEWFEYCGEGHALVLDGEEQNGK